MSNRASIIIDAYYRRPYKEYGRLISEIRESGGLTREEVQAIKSRILHVDAYTILRQAQG